MRPVSLLLLAACTVHGDAGPSLREPALRRLRVGAAAPAGWLKRELLLQARGITSQLPSFWKYIKDSRWMGGAGSMEPEQFVPYYLNGLIPLSYQLPDEPELAQLRERYVGYILTAQAEGGSGWLGPNITDDVTSAQNYWSKYFAVEAFEAYAEAAPKADAARTVAALVRHHRAFYQQLSHGAPPLSVGRWAYDRYEDGVAGIEWLLDTEYGGQGATGDTAFLWDLVSLLHTQADGAMEGTNRSQGAGYTWLQWFETGDPFSPWNDTIPTAHLLRHGVDIGQAMKLGALLWRLNGDGRLLASPGVAVAWAEEYLHMPDGMYFADEMVNGAHTASRGTETCSVVEMMNSMRVAYEVTGNVTYMDRLERIAFNALPASLWDDVTANVYHHCANQVEAASNHFSYSLYFCCSANVHQGWPKFVLSAVQRRGGAVVVSGYAPSLSTFPDGSTLSVTGDYPFSDDARLTLSAPMALQLRVPCWCERARVRVDAGAWVEAAPCGFHAVNASGAVEIVFENAIRLHTWRASNVSGQASIQGGGVEVHRGALVYALRPQSNVTATQAPYAPKNSSIQARSVKATSPWNYALLTSSLTFEPGLGVPDVPFSSTAPPPCVVKAQARRVPEWTAVPGAEGVAPVPKSPLSSQEPLEDIVLVPYGSTNVRISVFPSLVE
eukprot:TRINITY_DN25848_c0_g1_i1.p1 TRINITY_DN25848_c0_g1~~TRINITY_DN25848_c0_g1_i1.p1  ORF type:complete len:667 (+),score=229.17 TRINITY_DN25848_c0_g1_i1:78-2078(+)